MRVALDTNLLVYAEGVNGAAMQRASHELLQKLPRPDTVLPAQVLAELFNVLVRRAGRSAKTARAAVQSWLGVFAATGTSPAAVIAATDLATRHQFVVWDSMVICSAAESRCRILLSEDLQHGFTWDGVTVVNPFHRPSHPLLEALLEGGSRL